MSFKPYSNFVEMPNSNDLVWTIIYGISQASFNKFLKPRIRFNKKSIWINFQWTKIIGLGVLSLFFAQLTFLFDKLNYKWAKNNSSKIMFKYTLKAMMIFVIVDPQAYAIFKKFEDLSTQIVVDKITGINTTFSL